jgi:uncharacterized protein with GYD domain
MPRYIFLVDWTDQGAQAVEGTVDRLEHGGEIAEAFGCEIEHVWWTQGGHDMVSVVNAPDHDTARLDRRRDAPDRRPAAALDAGTVVTPLPRQ